MGTIRSAAIGVLLTFGTIQVTAQPGSVPAAVTIPHASVVAPNTTGTIQGTALTPSNGQAADRVVQLRNAETGRVVATQTTNNTGAFSFANVDAGNYIVEVVAGNQSVLAASSVVTLHAGEVVATAVKLPLLASGGILGGTAAMASIVAASAAAAGVLAVQTVGDPTCPQ
jgi:hypothetical protein